MGREKLRNETHKRGARKDLPQPSKPSTSAPGSMSGTESPAGSSLVDVVDVTAMSAEDLLKKATEVHFGSTAKFDSS